MTFGYTQWGGRPVMLMDSSSSALEGLALEMAGSWPHFFFSLRVCNVHLNCVAIHKNGNYLANVLTS